MVSLHECKIRGFLVMILVLCVALGLARPLAAQSYTATLEGLVTDASGAVVPGAKVDLTNQATNVKQTKNSDGRGFYFFPFLPPGPYKLTVEMAGFKTFERTDIILQVQQSVKVNVELAVGVATERVEVTGEAPRLDNVYATLGRVVENVSIDKLPNLGRDPLALAQLAPGIVPVGGYQSGGGVNFSANGGRLNITDVLLDGVSVGIQEHNGGIQDLQFIPKTETVQEFKVQTNSFTAEYGMSGNAVINVVTKSGSNELHGDGFYLHRRSDWMAQSFFNNAAGLKLCPESRSVCELKHRLGGAGGGPVYIPKLYNGRNKTFFFFHYERDQNPPSSGSGLDRVPTALEKNGDFSQSFKSTGEPITIYDPTTVRQDAAGNWIRNPFPGNKVPKESWNPVALAVMPFWPDPTSDGRTPAHYDNYSWRAGSTTSWYELNAKIDHYFTEKQRLAGRYSRQYYVGQENENRWGPCPSGYTGNPAWCAAGNFMLPEGYGFGSDKRQNAVLDYTNTINPTTILSVRTGFSRVLNRSDRVGAQGSFDESTIGFSGTPMQIQQPPRFWMEDYTCSGNACGIGPSPWFGNVKASDIRHVIGSLTKVRGVHTFKAGGEGRFQRLHYAQPAINTGEFEFCRKETAREPLNPGPNDGSALASFMTGFGGSCVTGRNGQTFVIAPLLGAHSYAFYVADDYRATPRLTLNLGLRYELNKPVTERHNRLNWMDLGLKSPLADAVAANPLAQAFPNLQNLHGAYVYASPSQRLPYDTDTNDFAPRFGFAYQFARQMVVRGGYGIFYGLSSAQAYVDPPTGFVDGTGVPWSLDGVHQNIQLVNPFPNGIRVPIGYKVLEDAALARTIDQGSFLYGPIRDWNVTPFLQQWSLSIERELPANSVFEIAYSGSKGTHLGFGTARNVLNNFDPSYLSLGDELNRQVPNPFYGLVPATSDLGGSPTLPQSQLLKPFPQFSGMSGRPGPPHGNSIYHGVQLKYTKRLTHGLQVTTHYTFSKLISDSDSADDPNVDWLAGVIRANGGQRPRIQNWGNLRGERSISILDITHRWVADFSYQLPIGRGKALGGNWNRVLDAVAGGWQINGIISMASGPPILPHLAGSNLGGATAMAQRPNLLFEPDMPGSVQSRLNGYLNPEAFSRPAPYTFGNAPRALSKTRAPGFRGGDMSAFKQFYLSENRARYVELRAEVFNVTNTPVFGGPNAIFGSGGFGVIEWQVNPPRQLQLQGKIYF